MLLLEKIESYRVLLASASPRRAELMRGAGFHFEQCPGYAVDESYPDDLPTHEVAEYIAVKKSAAYSNALLTKDLLITADTIVVVGNEILGKPSDNQDAKRMLRLLSDRTHSVLTGVCLRTHENQLAFTARSEVRFRALSEAEIDYYVSRFLPLDKAGAYGIQEWIGYVGIKRIEGSYFNVMGLPIQQLYVEIERMIG